MDGMSFRSGRLQTLPDDGTVLEEVIAEMESQFGTPATPQEYRLIVKVASQDETAAASEDRPGQEAGASADAQGSKKRRRPGRRRNRRKSSGERQAPPAE